LVALLTVAPAPCAAQSARKTTTRNPHGPLADTCDSCHTLTSWKPIRSQPEFNHNKTAYPLRGMHEKVDCRGCHINPVFSDVGTKCADCHADLHRGQFGAKCEQCHTVKGWNVAVQAIKEHNNRFPLVGAHSAVECTACHTGAAVGQFAGLHTECVSCHLQDYRNTSTQSIDHRALGFSTTCENCHTLDSWLGAKFDHSITGFALAGAHAKLDCTACHIGGRFAGTPADCYGCHAKDFQGTTNPNHVNAGFSQNCILCHSLANWQNAKFDHNQLTKFPLTGKHATTGCAGCHTDNYAGTLPTNCYGCHQKDYNNTANISGVPNHVTAGMPQDCALCHSTTNWLNATFDHNKTSFPLTGFHVTSVACATCHTDNYKGTLPTNCYGCHQKDYNKTATISGVPNHVTANMPQDCTLCHSTTNWLNASFDHNKTTFPLTGFHTSVACATCHTDNYKGTLPTNCYGCHQKDYNNTANIPGVPNHSVLSYPQDCTQCHSTSTWLNATFNHNTTAFPLTGFHTGVACATCHTDNYTGTLPTNCYGCHAKDYNNTANITGVPNHVADNFPQDCSGCHTTTNWLNATFNHNSTSFPLTGFHTGVACATCHTDNYKGTLPANCYGCHAKDYNNTANIAGVPNHVTANFPQDCTVCHSTTNWLNAAFNHNTTSFPLTGFHTGVACATCHTDNYKGTLPTNCYGCHQKDYNNTATIPGVPNHAALGYPQDCTICHTTANWLNATFNHNLTPFPLTGKHADPTVLCSQCHVGGRFPGTPTDCYSCHTPEYKGTTNPNHAAAGFPTTCQTCHNTTNWLNANFNHTWFPTPHHSISVCSDCHNNPNNYAVFSCTNCHTHNKTVTDNHHQGVSGYVYNSANCYACHPQGTSN
jgi:hypothetical protein